MSEAERKRRSDYKRNRKKWMLVQIIAIALVTLLVIGSTFIYYQKNKTFYIDYSERSEIDYTVHLKQNDFYAESTLDKGQAYVASLIDRVVADFEYELNMGADDVDYEYTYKIDAQLQVLDASGVALFNPVYELVPETTAKQSSNNKLQIREKVSLDYGKYNSLATDFANTFELKEVESKLVVTMHIEVNGASAAFEADAQNTYSTSLYIPLSNKTVNVEIISSVPDGESKVLACGTESSKDVFKLIAIIAAVLDVLLVVVLIIFAYRTRNDDINYTIKVKRLLSSYRSFIQQISNEYDTEGYQILHVSTFAEMLGIRDTIQAPILMHENGDQTCTQFMIPTNTKLLYMYEIKVDNYDLIYGDSTIVMLDNDDADQEDAFDAELDQNVDSPEVETADEDMTASEAQDEQN